MKLKHVNKSFGSNQVLTDINLEIPAGQVTVLVGPSGSGKSTILRSLNLLEQPESGHYEFDEHLQIDFSQPLSKKDLLYLRQNTGMVFQDYNLFSHLNILDNITAAPRHVLKQSKAAAEATAKKLLAKVNLADKAQSLPDQLSGGQAQRVAIARALAMNPKFILLDEPTSALDPELEAEVLKVLLQLAKEKQSLVIVTHNLAFAQAVADKIVFVEAGQILYDGPGTAFFAQENQHPRIKRFISSMTFTNLL